MNKHGSAINQWKQTGNVFLWTYIENKKNYPGWHISADSEGCSSLIELLSMMQCVGESSERTINLSPPSPKILSIPNNKGGEAKWSTVEKFKIKFTNDNSVDLSMAQEDSKVTFVANLKGIKSLAKGITDISNGQGDYAIEVSNGKKEAPSCLWFWWHLK